MPSLFYSYAFLYIITKVWGLIKPTKNEKPVQIDMFNINLPALVSHLVNFDMLIFVVNTIWVWTGVFYHETLLFGIIIFLNMVNITVGFGLTMKGVAFNARLISVINCFVKIAIAVFIIIKHFF